MDYKINDFLNHIFKEIFDNATLGYYNDEFDIWYGFINKNGNFIVGYADNENNQWYYDGPVFSIYYKLFGVKKGEFDDKLKEYLNKTYNLDIHYIM